MLVFIYCFYTINKLLESNFDPIFWVLKFFFSHTARLHNIVHSLEREMCIRNLTLYNCAVVLRKSISCRDNCIEAV